MGTLGTFACGIKAAVNYAVFFYDPQKKVIAFRFVKQHEKGVFKLTKERSAATVSVLSFIKANKLNRKNFLGWYDREKVSIPEIGEVYVLQLDKK
ncbi:hypothetical protein A3D84_00190 [Candidatus Woesebacteria bacterium RIFCSPHIGHO2_02_FULL_42_20]|uniref:Uncharacterized protein n=1 Tax=Candidatus Woesebacteria bacterium RIFCSPHIGHO2_12_FULL_41_24 TaxID=1802510 RepID=A0A1F8ATN0_9BACT|nr:MAG: hypothetical protein A2W15_01690 [Candidatus Woesebacteria bacterium RBG_16_41_13]OGM29670.1 MAG: hypothetical protein A2873_02110 [Candidatus Woesebacteria bacterium RIFCSPHIGHO2_01_FULL_42_80]OGM35199.1 MAG: hypothetical protein A3D84_00190 [Candidatus Woesebacteria bacterium RIFCSPHIGHO2_02_FULL_42_20]OGM55092.1 MAG: hypothetical protein A3E44_04195 [Candidatus Woesebacteria bacterium RIFCSPHIGHO2_12_FULL_41_24]OGM67665.1 MAG: hypothetical protein A2969_01900 [Candidatus Woesebacteri